MAVPHITAELLHDAHCVHDKLGGLVKPGLNAAEIIMLICLIANNRNVVYRTMSHMNQCYIGRHPDV